MNIARGRPDPLGATFEGGGTNFAIYSASAHRVELCFFDARGTEKRVDVPHVSLGVWHCFVPGIKPGQRYGYRVHGPFDPANGLRANPAKLLVDPYARAIAGGVQWDDAVYGFRVGDPGGLNTQDDRDSAPFVPKSVVVAGDFDWGADARPGYPWRDTIVYELHPKGFTAAHPKVPKKLRGTYAGLGSKPITDYLNGLGITSVELLPVHHHVHDHALVKRGLTNYWGYQTLGYFAPHSDYAASGEHGQQVTEFKQMVKDLHAAGIEVIIDVVYNHTCEWDEGGPTLSFKGIDNATYYHLDPADRSKYYNVTGVGNTFNTSHPVTLRLVMDSLRYWASEMHVDGFRFDLACALGRDPTDYDQGAAFFDALQQDPVLRGLKIKGEPWDVGWGGYQIGNLPPLWSEWNGKFRDDVRDYWRGAGNGLSGIATRFSGSADLYDHDHRKPQASINFITAHDGFTLRDLVSYNVKHNEANGDNNTDGESHNRSWNCGVEGPTSDPAVEQIRDRQVRNFLLTLMVSQGVPMLLAGDEMGRTQQGNNNAYCHDNELAWVDWDLSPNALQLQDFTRRLIAMRRENPLLRRESFFTGRAGERGLPDVAWLTPSGIEMTPQDWGLDYARCLSIYVDGLSTGQLADDGTRLEADTLLINLNAHDAPMEFSTPPSRWGARWEMLIDTNDPEAGEGSASYGPGDVLKMAARSAVVLRLVG